MISLATMRPLYLSLYLENYLFTIRLNKKCIFHNFNAHLFLRIISLIYRNQLLIVHFNVIIVIDNTNINIVIVWDLSNNSSYIHVIL